MQARGGRLSILGATIVPFIFFVFFCISAGIGAHRVIHMNRTADFLAHDPGCKTQIALTTPVSQSPGCRIVHGMIVRGYEEQEGTQYNGGTAYDQYLVFAPSDGAPASSLFTKRFYSSQRQPPPGSAVAEYVDGEIDYVTSASATIGPIFNPAEDTDMGWFLIALGAFFFAVGAGIAIVSTLGARRRTKRRSPIAAAYEKR
jgi:hypothetical protein